MSGYGGWQDHPPRKRGSKILSPLDPRALARKAKGAARTYWQSAEHISTAPPEEVLETVFSAPVLSSGSWSRDVDSAVDSILKQKAESLRPTVPGEEEAEAVPTTTHLDSARDARADEVARFHQRLLEERHPPSTYDGGQIDPEAFEELRAAVAAAIARSRGE